MSAKSDVLHGAAVLQRMLDLIGDPDHGDHDVAKAMVEGEMVLRELLRFALAHVIDNNS